MDDKQIDAIDNQIAELQEQKKKLLNKNRGEALTTARASVSKYGFTAAELGLTVGKATKTKDSSTTEKIKAPAKYANPTNPSQTWAGAKGPRPLWVKTHLNAGNPLDDLLIKV